MNYSDKKRTFEAAWSIETSRVSRAVVSKMIISYKVYVHDHFSFRLLLHENRVFLLVFFGGGGGVGSSVKYLDLCFFSSLFTKLIITTEYLLPGRRSLILRARFLCFFQQKVDQWFDFTTIRIEISSFCLNIVN